ncbi:ribonuclease H-like domain-containing protein [bacterium]|nr:ribonuclease H-like domain-containing protein [bacterium]
MDLRTKLDLLNRYSRPQPGQRPGAAGTDIHRYIEGTVVSNGYGSCFVAETSFLLKERHGSSPLGLFQRLGRGTFARVGKDPALKDLDLEGALFIDTETTGLAGGAGTVPFLTGTGRIEGERFVIRQYFMRDYSDEAAVLEELRRAFAAASAVVSYNGKAYDMNLLASRYILNRIEAAGLDLPHLDLLFSSRRIWSGRLESCSLKHVERHILGFDRGDDVEGYLIPALYFDYLKSGTAERLVQVFTHNRFDILSLLALAGVAGAFFERPLSSAADPRDLLSIGRSLELQGEVEAACSCYEAVLERSEEREVRNPALLHLSYLLKRGRKWSGAVKVWERMLELGGFGLVPYEELAKYYEHRVRDFAAALAVVEKGLKRIEVVRELRETGGYRDIEQALRYRRARLRRKNGETDDG